ncbi:MAG: NAD+ synthase [Candidatus Omnitrophica bacterium]|nr:NAD+ synthase [Candidatus Omnitrophota bacterium]
MKNDIRLALAQVNCTVGDLSYNAKKITDYIKKGEKAGADIISFPELAITGYPPEDLLFKAHFVERNIDTLKEAAKSAGDIVAIMGFADRRGVNVYNAAAIIYKGKIRAIYHKMILPNYGVFDEVRYFKFGAEPLVFKLGDIIFGVSICEDIWHKKGPVKAETKAGAKVIITINSSPYHIGRIKERERIIQANARNNNVFVSYTNLVGGQDELVFDGRSMVVNDKGRIIGRAKAFEEDLLITDITVDAARKRADKDIIAIEKEVNKKASSYPARLSPLLENAEEVYTALILGLKDYVTKNGFKKVVVGLSGGVDSALVATMAVDALGKENVIGVFMPSRYSSQESADDAKALASNLQIRYEVIPIEQIFKIYLITLASLFAGHEKNIAEENLQARIRGNMLMALSNKFAWLVLTTGNKSEMSTGYATLYGDMAGGFAVIKDVPKTLVYKLARYRNSILRVIPESVLTKEPTAELKPNQKDRDTLPPYDRLDPILKAYVEDDRDVKKIISSGCAKEDVLRVVAMVDRSEYKRRQSPPGIRITPRAFGKDRRMPITDRYKEY